MKYINYIILLVLLCTAFLLKDHLKVSTNLVSLFASQNTIKKLDIADNLGYSKEMFVVIKGFSKASKSKVRRLSKELKKIDRINFVQSSIIPTKQIQEFYKKYYPLLATFDNKHQSADEIKNKLQKLYNSQFSNIFYSAIDKNDPLKLFKIKNLNNTKLSYKGSFITLENYGYLIRVRTDVSPSQMNDAKILYKDIHRLLDNYQDVVSFAPFYYTVENSMQIQKDVQQIVALSSIILFLIYFVLLKNIKLLMHTLIVLASSMIFAGLISTLVFDNFNILSLAFGMSLSAVSIDYLFHYYFHNFYKNSKKIDKNVLYGYLTTMVAFGIFSFIPIAIISQISFFAVLSLSFAYILFTFVFKKLDIPDCNTTLKDKTATYRLPSYLIFITSIIFLFYSSFNIKFDTNLKNLDYQNINLLNIEKMFKNSKKQKLTPVIIQAKSKNELIDNLYKLRQKIPKSFSLASFIPKKSECLQKKELLKSYDFHRLNTIINQQAKQIGFKESYFNQSYVFTKNLASCDIDDFKVFNPYGLDIYKKQNNYFTMAFVDNLKIANSFDFVSSIDIKEIFTNQVQEMYKNLLLFSLMVVSIIFILLILSVKKRFLYALNYIIFPVSLTLAILVSISEVNLMHLFSLIILIAIGIDYGIYMSNTNKPNNTMLAIKYSILSTFAAFGVLAFSSITALYSIGIVISLGTLAIFILTKVMK